MRQRVVLRTASVFWRKRRRLRSSTQARAATTRRSWGVRRRAGKVGPLPGPYPDEFPLNGPLLVSLAILFALRLNERAGQPDLSQMYEWRARGILHARMVPASSFVDEIIVRVSCGFYGEAR